MKVLLLAGILLSSTVVIAQNHSKEKKVKSFQVVKVLDLPADEVWAVVGEDYGSVANLHPKIISSDYINGSLQACEGAERVCNFNEKGTLYLKEKMVNYNPEQMTFINQVYQAGKFPVDPELTRATYKVEGLGDQQSRISFDMQYRAKPAYMGGMMKRGLQKTDKRLLHFIGASYSHR